MYRRSVLDIIIRYLQPICCGKLRIWVIYDLLKLAIVNKSPKNQSIMDAAKEGRRSRNKVISILVTTSHPVNTTTTTTSTTNTTAAANVGGALTLLCPRTGTIQCSTRIHGGDHNNNNNTNMASQQLMMSGSHRR